MYTPPTGYPPQNPQQYGTPPGMVPPGQKRSGGCWLWGATGCLVFVIVIVGFMVYGVHKLATSKGGAGLLSGMGSLMSSTNALAGDMTKGTAVEKALVKYKTDNGHYPDSLSDLVPSYIPTPATLHLASDPNTDPTHNSFTYTKPSASAPDTTPVLSFHAIMNMDMGASGKMKMDSKYTYLVNQTMNEDMTQTVTDASGKTTTSTTHVSGATPGSSPFGSSGSSGTTPTTP